MPSAYAGDPTEDRTGSTALLLVEAGVEEVGHLTDPLILNA